MNKAKLTISGNLAKGFWLRITLPITWLEKFHKSQKKWLLEIGKTPFITVTKYGTRTYSCGFAELERAKQARERAIDKLEQMKKTLAFPQDVNETVEVDL